MGGNAGRQGLHGRVLAEFFQNSSPFISKEARGPHLEERPRDKPSLGFQLRGRQAHSTRRQEAFNPIHLIMCLLGHRVCCGPPFGAPPT